jgi:hypothetical protein
MLFLLIIFMYSCEKKINPSGNYYSCYNSINYEEIYFKNDSVKYSNPNGFVSEWKEYKIINDTFYYFTPEDNIPAKAVIENISINQFTLDYIGIDKKMDFYRIKEENIDIDNDTKLKDGNWNRYLNSDCTIYDEINDEKVDTSKFYQRINIPYIIDNKLTEEYEAYVSKKKDTFWNTWKFYKKNGVIDSSKSKFFDFHIVGKKSDSILKGKVSIFSPADSIPNSQISSREVTLVYLQKENDSLIMKEIKTDKNIIEFDYKNYENYGFEGHIMDLRFIKIDSTPDKLLLNRNFFTIDTKVSTDNIFVDLLK